MSTARQRSTYFECDAPRHEWCPSPPPALVTPAPSVSGREACGVSPPHSDKSRSAVARCLSALKQLALKRLLRRRRGTRRAVRRRRLAGPDRPTIQADLAVPVARLRCDRVAASVVGRRRRRGHRRRGARVRVRVRNAARHPNTVAIIDSAERQGKYGGTTARCGYCPGLLNGHDTRVTFLRAECTGLRRGNMPRLAHRRPEIIEEICSNPGGSGAAGTPAAASSCRDIAR